MEKHYGKSNGFSLIELLIIVAILAIVLAVGLPSMERSFQRQKINGIGDNLHYLLRYARAQAAKSNKTLWLKFKVDSSDAKIWRVAVTDDSDCEFTVAKPCLVNGISQEFSNENYQGVTIDNDTDLITLDPIRGRGDAADATITFKLDDIDVKFEKSTMGSHTVCTSDTATNSRYPACD